MPGYLAVVIGVLSLCVPILILLITLIWQSGRTHGSRLAAAIEKLGDSLDADRRERKEDREKDQRRVGMLYDRMQAQETRCEENLKRCPHQGKCREE